ncbi:MAG: pirin family protein [Candidatus Kapabacteria bacterium]|nr:pirin family protein [Candidatus Kapabacteria bacterium]
MIIIHNASSRGHSNHGWLDSFHSFSFADYYNPNKMNFGALRVLNDDKVIGGEGFGTHPHNNMEIVSIPILGEMTHQDSSGNEKNIIPGEVQIMSAGTGIYHSEYNSSPNEDLRFLQIWVMPKEKDIKPRYDQRFFDLNLRKNLIQNVVSPSNSDALWINQDAYFSLSNLEKNNSVEYKLNNDKNGVYIFLIEGEILVKDVVLKQRDSIGIHNEGKSFELKANQDSKILIIEIPMEF